uniref:Leucine-rich repeat-containing N-terminal plant-type domain-containing protein n=1 Tax=Zea mays TaxID=4577 RepID=C4J706_MAIZE|nr:unknown [Zea mays]
MTRHCAEAAAATAPSLLRVLLALHCGVLFLQCSAASAMGGDVSALMAFKRAIIEDPHSVLSDWTDADGNACDWRGVICSAPQGSVISLKLSNSSLKGFIAPELGRLSFLQELYLDHNLLFGTIPKLIGSLKNLRVLDLSVNRLTGPIPSELGGLSSVSIVNFHSNGLTGNIPSELGKLQNLVELRLDRNRLKGSIPGSNTDQFFSCFKYWIHSSQWTMPFFPIICCGFFLQLSCRKNSILLEISSKVKFPRKLLPG